MRVSACTEMKALVACVVLLRGSESAYLVNNGALNLTAPLLHGQSASLVNNKRMSIGNESTTLISDTT